MDEDLSTISNLDNEAEIQKKKWTKLLIVSVVALLLSWFLGPTLGVAQYALLGASFFLLVTSGVKLFTEGKMDTEDRRYELVQEMLKLISSDIDDGTPLKLHMNLNKPNRKENADGEASVYGWKVKYYRDPWLEVRGRFLDGTKFQVMALEKYQHRSKWKTSASGKKKHKTKTKTATEFIINLRFKSTRYPNMEALTEKARGAVKLPSGLLIKSVELSAGQASLRTNTKTTWHGVESDEPGLNASHGLASMFLSLYQILNLSRDTSKRTTQA
jgi:hypothetical protein